MTDKFLIDATAPFQLGQTVIAKVTNLDEEKRRFLVTLKISEVIPPEGGAQTRLINGLQERRAVTEMLAMRGTVESASVYLVTYAHKLIPAILPVKCDIFSSLILRRLPSVSKLSSSSPPGDSDLRQQLAALSVGQRLKLTVDTLGDDDTTFKSDDLIGATILATKYHAMGMYGCCT